LQRLDDVCEFLGIDLADLTAQSRASEALPHRLSATQEKALAADPLLLALLRHLLKEIADLDAALPSGTRRSIGFVTALRPWKFSLMDAIAPRIAAAP